MTYPNATKIVTHLVNGFADDEKFVEVDGEKFVADDKDPTKPKLDDKGGKIPFKPKSSDDDKGGKGGEDESNKSLEELAKTNPAIAKLLDDKKKLEDDAKKKADDDKRKAEEDAKKKGEWQKLAEDRGAELETTKKELEKKDTILGKYVGSVKEILKEVIATIPKENLGLIPEDFSPREKLEYITKNAKLLGAKISGGKGGNVPPNDKNPNATDEDKIVEEIAELQKKTTKTSADNTKLWELSKKLKEIRANKK